MNDDVMRAYEAAVFELHRRAHLGELPNPRRIGDVLDVITRDPPASALEARDFYNVACDNWGNAFVRCVTLAGTTVHAVIASTDGDDGWVELYDDSGALIAAARTYLEIVAWLDRDDARAFVTNSTAFPAALADRVNVANAHRATWDADAPSEDE